MCGINGIIKSQIDKNDINKVYEMNKILSHRGPDFSDIWSNENIVLGHTRLSIIDLNPRSNQPFAKDNLVIVFNGEIYNYLELKKELSDVNFSTNSDTEVILELWKKYKENSFDMLRGMFAFAIYDTITNETIIARDHFGIKPLYYVETADFFAFSSEIKALYKIPGIKASVDSEMLHEYITFQFTLTNDTLYEGIKKVEPAHYIYIQNAKIHEYKKIRYTKGIISFLKNTYSKYEKTKDEEEMEFWKKISVGLV